VTGDTSYNPGVRLLPILGLLAAGFAAQTQPRPGFEVATLKRNTNCQIDPTRGPSPGRLDLVCLPIRAYIRVAYGVFTGNSINARRIEVLGGPAWLDSERYDLAAKAAGPAPPVEMMGPMLQMLLEERLQLKVHTEPRETAVYEMILPFGKPKFQPVKDGSCTPMDFAGPAKPGDTTKYCGAGTQRPSGSGTTAADWTAITMDELAGRMLPSLVDRPVVNRTGLKGRYDIHLEFGGSIRTGEFLNGEPVRVPPSDSTGPSIFTALQSLGLKLTPAKAPLDVIVIDRVERPSEH
jgi:uncharacterized protein (TIGR03435 family)